MLNAAVCQHERPDGAPLITHAQDVVLNVAVCPHESPVGASACVPLTIQEQDVVLNVAICQHERPDGTGPPEQPSNSNAPMSGFPFLKKPL